MIVMPMICDLKHPTQHSSDCSDLTAHTFLRPVASSIAVVRSIAVSNRSSKIHKSLKEWAL